MIFIGHFLPECILLRLVVNLQPLVRQRDKVQLIVILCCGVVYDCSHTAEIDMHDVVMKGVTCYKDASEHDRVLQWEQWCPCVQGGGQLDVTS